MSSSASRSKSKAPTLASSSRNRAPSSSSRLLNATGPSEALPDVPLTPPPAVVRNVCTVIQSCRKTFSNHNNWAQHETSAHRWIGPLYEDLEAYNNERNKTQQPTSAQHQADALRKSNAHQRANALRKADALASTYDIYFCNGVDGCLDGWYKRVDFEAHFREKHTMDWNKIPRSPVISDYLLGPEHGVRMWCGFCNMVYLVANKESWYHERLTHVASHFDFTCDDEIWIGNIYGWYFPEMH